MLTTLIVLHVFICLFIVGVVLLQATQQANMGGMFGGGASQTVFGSGTQTALGKATTVAAVMFFSTCILISFVVEKERSVIKRSETILQEQLAEQTAPPEEPAPGSLKMQLPPGAKTQAPPPQSPEQSPAPAPEP